MRELQRDFRKIDKGLAKEVRDGLREGGDIVRVEASSRFTRYDARSAAGYKTRVRQRGVAVEQSIGRTTGKRPDFGRLQMDRALEPALEDKRDQVIDSVDKVLGRLAGDNGF